MLVSGHRQILTQGAGPVRQTHLSNVDEHGASTRDRVEKVHSCLDQFKAVRLSSEQTLHILSPSSVGTYLRVAHAGKAHAAGTRR